MKKLVSNLKLWLVASVTLGLAPFRPEPHIWSKLKWVLDGAVGMQPMDWFDLMMHGTPWVFLTIALILNVKKLLTNSNIQ